MAHHVCDEAPLVPSCIISGEKFDRFIGHKQIIPVYSMLSSLRAGAYVVTFDDALDDLYSIVYPYMAKRSVPFTAFISAELLDRPGYITTGQLKEMAGNPLVTIGSHGCTHRHLSRLSNEESRWEIYQSKRLLESIIGKEVDLIAYPFGDAGKREFTLARQAGYRYGFGVTPRKYNILSKLFMKMNIPRYNLSNESSNPA